MDPNKDIPSWVFTEERRKIEMLNEIGILDKTEVDTVMAMVDFVQKYQTAYIPIQNLYKYVNEYGLKVNNNALKVESNIITLLRTVYPKLSKKNLCAVDNRDGKVVAFILIDPSNIIPEEIQAMVQRLKKEYTICENEANKPFPMSSMLPKNFQNPKYLVPVQANELLQDKMKELLKKSYMVQVFLGEDFDVVIPTEDLPELYNRAFMRLKKILQNSRELCSLMIMKIKQQYPNQVNLSSAEDLMRTEGREPQYWAALATEVLNYSRSSEKDLTLSQAAQIVKFMSILQGEQNQKKTHEEKSLDILSEILKTYKVSFNKTQLLQMRDKHNYLKLYNERDYIDVVNNFLQKYTQPDKPGYPPVLIPLKVKGEERWIYRDHFFHLFFDALDSVTYEIRRQISEKCYDKSAKFSQSPAMQSEANFAFFVDGIFQKLGDFLLFILNDPALLFSMIHFIGSKEPAILKQMDRFFYPLEAGESFPRKKSTPDILLINYHEFLREAKGSSSFSFFDWLGSLFKGFGSKMNQAVESQLIERKKMEKAMKDAKKREKLKSAAAKAGPAKEVAPAGPDATAVKKAAYKKGIEEAISHLTDGQPVGTVLAALEKKWNHILNPDDRKEFNKAVHSKIVGRIRFMQKFTPEDIKKEISDMMSTERFLTDVSDHEALKKYTTLYLMEAIRQKL